MRPAKTQIRLGIRLIRVFAVRMKKNLGPELLNERTEKTLIGLGGCPGCSESSMGAQEVEQVRRVFGDN